MPLTKYETFEEAQQDQWVFEPDAVYYQKLHHLFDWAAKLNDFKYPQGVFKFRTFEEANTDLQQHILNFAIQKRKRKSNFD